MAQPAIRGLGALAAVGLMACVDQPVCLTPPGGAAPATLLSELGVFAGQVAAREPAPGFIPYDVSVSLYSDEASKHRLLHLPKGARLHATADRWEIPAGTMLVKTFYYPLDARVPGTGEQAIETRFLVFGGDGVLASTYLWNADGTDATCSGGNVEVPTKWIDAAGAARSDPFHVPGTSQCASCHAGRALGLRTRQMDLPGTFSDGTQNQVDHLVALGALDARPPVRGALAATQGPAPLQDRARSYLDANCGHCHGEGGEAAGTGLLLNLENTGPGKLALCRPTAKVDGRDRVIVPGHPEQSEILARMRSPDPFVRMPQGPTRLPDKVGLAVLSEWIAGMGAEDCP